MIKKKSLLKGMIILGLLVFGTAVFYQLTVSRERPNRGAKPVNSPTVQVVPVTERDVPIIVTAMGEVQPARSVNVVPQVGGRVMAVSRNLIPGGMVKKNEILFRLDPRDYDLALRAEQAAVSETQLMLEEQEGRRAAAKRELELVDEELAPTAQGMRLASRESHVENARAQLDGAESRLAKAKLDRNRTVLRAPFDARVVQKNIDKGQVVSTQTVVAVLIDAHEVWVEATLPLDRLQWIDVPGTNSEKGSPVTVRQRIKGSKDIVRSGEVLRLLPGLDEKGKLARLLIAVESPFEVASEDRTESASASLPLLVGSFVQVEIRGHTISGLLAIPRGALREGDSVWIRDEQGKLAIRSIETIWNDDDTVFVKGNLKEGDAVVVSRLASAIPGMSLSLAEASSADQDKKKMASSTQSTLSPKDSSAP
jgi:RND family efflux transporter MFP subunit